MLHLVPLLHLPEPQVQPGARRYRPLVTYNPKSTGCSKASISSKNDYFIWWNGGYLETGKQPRLLPAPLSPERRGLPTARSRENSAW